MSKRGLPLVVVLAMGAFAAPVVARTQTLTVENQAGVKPAYLVKVERAVQWQVNHQVRRYWRVPKIRFGQHGWAITLKSGPADGYGGDHGTTGPDATGTPFATVYPHATAGSDFDWSMMFSHEVVEMMVNPWNRVLGGWDVEVADPVVECEYWNDRHGRRITGDQVDLPANAISLSDFVTPHWFTGGRGPWDFDHDLIGPALSSWCFGGYAQRADGTTVNGGS